MRIAFVIGRFPALSETFILNQVTGLIDQGHEVDIFADVPDDRGCVHNEVVRYGLLQRTHYLPQLPEHYVARVMKGIGLIAGSGWKSPRRVMRSLDSSRYGQQATSLRLLYAAIPFLNKHYTYDIIHCHFGTFGLRGLFLRDIGVLSGRLVTTFHGADITEAVRAYGRRVYSRLFASGDLFLPISQRWKDALIDLGCPAEKTVVHHMGIDCTEFAFRSREMAVNGTIRLISVCRLVEKKGIEYAVHAVSKLIKANYRMHYDIIGDGPLREDLQKLIAELGVTGAITVHGQKTKTDVIAYLQRAHLLLAPSVTGKNGDQEGIPVALMEAMAMGLPVVSTWHSGIPELVKDSVCGFLVPEHDADALAGRIAHLAEHPEIWSALGRKGRTIVEQEFNIDRLNKRLISIFESFNTAK